MIDEEEDEKLLSWPASIRSAIVAMLLATSVARAQTTAASEVIPGAVVDARTSAPVPSAAVELFAAWNDDTTRVAHALTSDGGAFALRGIPPGRYVLRVRRIGYRTTTAVVDVAAARDTLEVALEPVPLLLGGTTVTANATAVARKLDAMGFTTREQAGIGRFMGPDEIARRRPRSWRELFGRGIPGCAMIFVNGVAMLRLSDVNLDDVIAFEWYAGSSEAPPNFHNPLDGAARCPSVVVWTAPNR